MRSAFFDSGVLLQYPPRILALCICLSLQGWTTAAFALSENGVGVSQAAKPQNIAAADVQDLESLLLEAYTSNPTLRASMELEPVTRANLVLAKTRINPKLNFQAAPAESTYHPVDLTVTVQLGFKRQRRIELAHRQLDSTNALIRTMAWKIRQDTSLAFYELAVAKKSLSVVEDYLAVTQRLFSIAQKRKDARDASGLDVLRADAAVSDAKNQLVQAQIRVRQATRQLNILLNRSTENSLNILLPDLLKLETAPPEVPSFPDLLTIAIQHRPEFKQIEANRNVQLASIKLAKSARWPDVQIGGGISSVSQTRQTFIGENFMYGPFGYLSIPLPINDHQQGPEAIARATYRQLEAQFEATITQVKQELNLAFSNFDTAEEQLDIFLREILPKQLRIVSLSERGFSVGVIDLTAAITAQQTALNARLSYLQAMSRYFQAQVELERAVGRPLDLRGTGKTK